VHDGLCLGPPVVLTAHLLSGPAGPLLVLTVQIFCLAALVSNVMYRDQSALVSITCTMVQSTVVNIVLYRHAVSAPAV
jgi:hypothetical protein